ncbi:hypothetical protein [Leifsonia sp. Leaf264]|uniref:hypothetical protein n=1 Tax=Leifsonia sp. Leaf264 TaxID=1736314 RepID=UPI0006FE949C|nr:hypothetical protein [Leifsonia sp. Leaf264]KQO98269.1 hypothetical protein ASF30_09415 [Leifsonia sp. Leaf264]
MPTTNTKRVIGFFVASAAALAVLVPATLSYGMPTKPESISNLDFASGGILDINSQLDFATNLDHDTLWKKADVSTSDPSTLNWASFESVDGGDEPWCTADIWTSELGDAITDLGEDREATQKWMDSVFSDSAPNETKQEQWAAFKTQTSGRTVDTLTVENGVSFTTMRASTRTHTGVTVNVTCQDDDELAKTLQNSVRLNTVITVSE